MDILAVFEELLHIVSPFQIRQIDKDEANRKVRVHVEISTTHRPLGFEEGVFIVTKKENGNI